MNENDIIICPRCGKDLGPQQEIRGALTRCLVCGIWVTGAGDIVEDAFEYFQRFRKRRERRRQKEAIRSV